MDLDRKVVQEVEGVPHVVTRKFLESLLDTLPMIKADNPLDPEWLPTPIHEIDLGKFGYKHKNESMIVYIKDESDKNSNPTGLIKDRRSYEIGPVLHRRFAENLWSQGTYNIRDVRVPRLSEITAGNIGLSQATMNEKWGLPPPKFLLDIGTPNEVLEKLMVLPTDIYLADLTTNIFTGRKDEPYTAEQIRALTNNHSGYDLTSSKLLQLQRDAYDWHWHEIFEFKPDEVYGPFGSGEWFSNGLTWQLETAKNGLEKKDVRLTTTPEVVTSIDILAAEPANLKASQANKLTGLKPFIYYNGNDIQGAKLFNFTGRNTGLYRVPESYIVEAYRIMSQLGFDTEPSAAAGLALYLHRFDQRLINPRKKVLIVNTGKGI